MTKPTHTPGPWFYDPHAAKIVVANDRFNPVAQIPLGWENAEANAHLIAAAPALLGAALAAAMNIHGVLEGDDLSSRTRSSLLESALKVLNDAIMRAGGTPVPGRKGGDLRGVFNVPGED